MKKVISVVLSVLLVASIASTTVFAAEPAQAKIGDTEYATLALAIDAANADADETTIELLTDVTATAQLTVSEATVINGNGHTITTNGVKKSFEVHADFAINDLTIVNTLAYGRCIDTRVGGIELNIVDSALITTNTPYTQPLTIGGDAGTPENVIVVNISGSEITAQTHGYGIITYNPVEMVISESTVTGYAALYFKDANGSVGSAGSLVSVEGSTLNGVNNAPSHESNTFATIVSESDEVLVSLDAASTLSCESNNASTQYLIGLKTNNSAAPVSANIIMAEEGAKLETSTKENGKAGIIAGTVMDVDDDSLVVNIIAVPSEYADAIFNDGEGYITATEPETGLTIITYHYESFTTLIGHTHSANNLTKVPGEKASCTEDGVAEHYTCAEEACAGIAYGDVNGSTIVANTVIFATGHSIVEVKAVAATTEKEGNIAHYKCEECDALFSDEEGENELAAEDVVIAKLVDDTNKDNDDANTGNTAPDTGSSAPDTDSAAPDTDNTTPDKETTSPATGDSFNAVYAVIAAIVFGAVVVLTRKAKANA